MQATQNASRKSSETKIRKLGGDKIYLFASTEQQRKDEKLKRDGSLRHCCLGRGRWTPLLHRDFKCIV